MNRRKLQIIKELDKQLKSYTELGLEPPRKGWINTIRKSLSMTLDHLADRMGVSKQNISLLEKREAQGTITIKKLKELGESLDLNFVYGFTSKHGSLEKMIEQRALEVAKQIVTRTSNNMVLENQKNNTADLEDNQNSIVRELMEQIPKHLWDH